MKTPNACNLHFLMIFLLRKSSFFPIPNLDVVDIPNGIVFQKPCCFGILKFKQQFAPRSESTYFLVKKHHRFFAKTVATKKKINSMVLNPLPTTVLRFNQDALDKEVLNGFEIEETKIIKRTDNTKKNKKMGFNKTLFNFVVVTFSKKNMTTKIQPSKCLCHRHSCHTSFGNPLHSSRASFQKSPRHNRHLAIPRSRDPFVLCDL